MSAGYENLGGDVGFIYGSILVAVAVLGFFFIAWMEGHSLEELDELFKLKNGHQEILACESFWRATH